MCYKEVRLLTYAPQRFATDDKAWPANRVNCESSACSGGLLKYCKMLWNLPLLALRSQICLLYFLITCAYSNNSLKNLLLFFETEGKGRENRYLHIIYYIKNQQIQLWQYCLLVTARSLYMFQTLSASIIRSTKTVVAATGACHVSG